MKKIFKLFLILLVVVVTLENCVYADVVSIFDPIYDAISYGFKPVMLIVIGLAAIIGISSLIIKKIQSETDQNSNKKEGE